MRNVSSNGDDIGKMIIYMSYAGHENVLYEAGKSYTSARYQSGCSTYDIYLT